MSILVSSIVGSRDMRPYVQIYVDGRLAQLSVAEARNVAADILQLCSRVEADAMIHRFFDKMEYPSGAANALMMEFRHFRESLDQEKINTQSFDPDDPPEDRK